MAIGEISSIILRKPFVEVSNDDLAAELSAVAAVVSETIGLLGLISVKALKDSLKIIPVDDEAKEAENKDSKNMMLAIFVDIFF